MDTRILVPLDGSPLAETALADALAIARRRQCGLLLLHVITPDMLDRAYRFHNAADKAVDYLESVQQRLAAHGVPVDLQLDEGDPAISIIHHAAANPAVALVAMATHGRSGIRRWIMGSVADKVFRSVHKPLLIMRPGDETADLDQDKRYRTVLVPLDGSPTAAGALSYARELAAEMQARLVLVGVAPELEDLLLGVGDTYPLWMNDSLQAQKASLSDYLERTAAELAAAGPPVQTLLLSGLPAAAILQACKDTQADILVVSSHGRSGFQRLWYGSVATRLVQTAPVPLLLINAGGGE